MAPPSTRVQRVDDVPLLVGRQEVQEPARTGLDAVPLRAKQIFARPDEPDTHILFPTPGGIVVLMPMSEEPSVDAALIGCAGMVGVPVAKGMAPGDRPPAARTTSVAGTHWPGTVHHHGPRASPHRQRRDGLARRGAPPVAWTGRGG